jgi:hypothetical protein
VHQSTVSLYTSRFRERVSQVGLAPAGREYNLEDEVLALRSSSVELLKAGFTAEEGRQGHQIVQAFAKLGAPPEEHLTLVEGWKQILTPMFVPAAIKLAKIKPLPRRVTRRSWPCSRWRHRSFP